MLTSKAIDAGLSLAVEPASKSSQLLPLSAKLPAHWLSRLRKVKCDEARPACRRCISTGRVCDGYGVWGGGGNYYGQRQRIEPPKERTVISLRPSSFSVLDADVEEVRHFQWFEARTVKKVPGFFALPFWNTLLFQACVAEPAVWHAVITLSSVHRRKIINETGENTDNTPDQHEKFMLRHYAKAIGHLQPHLPGENPSSTRVALITCVLFTCLEFLRGHFGTAEFHLHSGLKVISELRQTSRCQDGAVVYLQPAREAPDDWILEAFSKLHMQTVLWKREHEHPYLTLNYTRPPTPMKVFHSIPEAWKPMEKILNELVHLTENFRRSIEPGSMPHDSTTALFNHQQCIRNELVHWSDTFKMSGRVLQGRDSDFDVAGQLLGIYHTLASIMTEVCSCPEDESVFDSYTAQFVNMIDQLIGVRKSRSMIRKLYPKTGYGLNMARSVVSLGWIPPLYYTALKCRVHRVRLQAIRLLESSTHREGIWDSQIASNVARKVMEMEEKDFYRGFDALDRFDISSSPEVWDLSVPTIPRCYRLHDVKVDLPNGELDSVVMSCKHEKISGKQEMVVKRFYPSLNCWLDLDDDEQGLRKCSILFLVNRQHLAC
jgi:hypothetical protein